MTCPSCKGELSKIWRPQGSSKALTIPHVQWGCGICGQTFSKGELRPPKERLKAERLGPILL